MGFRANHDLGAAAALLRIQQDFRPIIENCEKRGINLKFFELRVEHPEIPDPTKKPNFQLNHLDVSNLDDTATASKISSLMDEGNLIGVTEDNQVINNTKWLSEQHANEVREYLITKELAEGLEETQTPHFNDMIELETLEEMGGATEHEVELPEHEKETEVEHESKFRAEGSEVNEMIEDANNEDAAERAQETQKEERQETQSDLMEWLKDEMANEYEEWDQYEQYIIYMSERQEEIIQNRTEIGKQQSAMRDAFLNGFEVALDKGVITSLPPPRSK